MTHKKTDPKPPTLLRLRLSDLRPLDWYGISAGELAQACGVTIRTAERWKDARAMPETAELCYRMRHGELGLIDASFAGFSLQRGFLWTRNGAEKVTAGDVEALPLTLQLVTDAQRRLREAAEAKAADVRLADERRAAALLGGFQTVVSYALPALPVMTAAAAWVPTGTSLPTLPAVREDAPRPPGMPLAPYTRHKRNGARA